MKKILFIGLVAFGVLGGCVSGGSSVKAGGRLEDWTNFDGKTIADAKLGDKQVRAVFMREEGAIDGPAVNIFVDGDYLASLLEGGYRSVAICSHGERVLSSFSRNDRFADRDTGIDYNFVLGETAYIRVVGDEHGQPILQRVGAEQGRQMLASLKQETQTLPRVKSNELCTQPVLDKFSLQAHALFEFDKSKGKDVLVAGLEEIIALSEKLRNQEMSIANIEVIGYTDPMGDANYNKNLSNQRAQTVKALLREMGVNETINAQGLGEANLLVRDCLSKHSGNPQARIACDQPNRRVEIIVYGNRAKNYQ